MDFVAIDFETANRRSDSACQLAAVLVKQSQIVDEYCWLIRPPRNYFSPIHISIHGICPSDVAGSPRMNEVWEQLAPLIDGQVLMAHNARFDVRVLVDSLAAYGMSCPDLEFQCTRALARSAWPNLSGYGLKALGNHLGISFRHHDALEDARCCARIALTIQSQWETSKSLAELERTLQLLRGQYRSGLLKAPKKLRGKGTNQKSVRHSDGVARTLDLEPATHFDRSGFPVANSSHKIGQVCQETIRSSCLDQPLLGKRIVMLGPLRGLTMQETVSLLEELGAEIQSEIGQGTHYVVVPGVGTSTGKQFTNSGSVAKPATGKEVLLASHRHADSSVRVLSERQFRSLIPGGAAGDR